MRVKTLSINNLRNICSAKIEIDPCLNCFIGDNGAGKTSVLEALAVLSKGRSFRSGQASSLIGPDAKHFQIVATIESKSKNLNQVGIERGNDSWTARCNGENVTQLSQLTQLLPYVLLEPGSHTLVSGSPDGRRKYLDWGVFHVKHDYLNLWRRYSRVLKQRNAALRQSSHGVVESLNPQFIEFGERLSQAREEHVVLLNQVLKEKLPIFSETLSDMALAYRKGWTGDGLGEAIHASALRDQDRGLTHPGPHKADLYLSMQGAPAKERLSRGEQKSMTAAMILAQAQLIAENGESPVLMLDDLSSELDRAHFEKVLASGLELDAQILLTGTSLSANIKSLVEDPVVFHVEQGTFSRD